MKIKVAPFAKIAIPKRNSAVARAYWQSDYTIESITHLFNMKSGKAVKKEAGPATLKGIRCKDCDHDIECTSREKAIQTIKEFDTRSRFRGGVQCSECFNQERQRKHDEWCARQRVAAGIAPKTEPKKVVKVGRTPTAADKKELYESWEWRELRLKTIQKHGRVCLCCGNRPGMFYASGEPVRIVVDHIKPISKYWHLRLEPSNLQPLCDECNQGKGNWDETDFRPRAPDEWVEAPQDDIVLSVLDELNEGTIQ